MWLENKNTINKHKIKLRSHAFSSSQPGNFYSAAQQPLTWYRATSSIPFTTRHHPSTPWPRPVFQPNISVVVVFPPPFFILTLARSTAEEGGAIASGTLLSSLLWAVIFQTLITRFACHPREHPLSWRVFRPCAWCASTVGRGAVKEALCFRPGTKRHGLFGRLHVLAIGINSPYAHASSRSNEQFTLEGAKKG